MSNELMNVDSMSMEELDILQAKIMNKKVNAVMERLERLESNQIKEKAQMELREARLEKELNETKEIAISHNRVKQPKYDFVNQSTFGSLFNVSISSARVGKLLKITGLAQESKRKTTPYRQYIPNLAKTRTGENYTTFVWHFDKCMVKIDDWLKSKDLYNKFYSIEYEKDMELFIDELYKKYL